MQVMEHRSMDNATLMSHMMQHEHEPNQLQRNAEQTFSGIFSGLDFVSRLQGKRSNELEQALESCEKKLNASQKENTKLQEELSEVYSIKSRFAEQLKAEIEKNAGLEKEVKYFQNRAAAGLSERDRLLLEVERLQRKRDGLIEKVTDLQDRLDRVTSECAEEKGLCEALYSRLEKLKDENQLYKMITEKFWKIREQFRNTPGVEDMQDRALFLLQETESLWHYGESELHSQNDAEKEDADEELMSCHVSLANLQLEYEKEISARKEVENNLSCWKSNMFHLTELISKEFHQLRLLKGSLEKEAFSFFSEETKWILSLQEFLNLVANVEQTPMKEHAGFDSMNHIDPSMMEADQDEINAADTAFSCRSRATSKDIASVDEISGMEHLFLVLNREEGARLALSTAESAESFSSVDPVENPLEKPCLVHKFDSKGSIVEDHLCPSTDDGKALAQALQEKVAALLLLSQQEERHLLESNTTLAMESQILSLKEQLVQVTNEKMDALVKLACTQEKCLKLQEQEKTFKKLIQNERMRTNGPVNAAAESTASTNCNGNMMHTRSRKALMQGYLKHLWLKGQGLGVHTSLSHMLSLRRSNEDDTVDDARLRRSSTNLR